MELFTSTTCGPCLPQNTTLNRYLDPMSAVYAGDLADKWILLRYHVWWPSAGDPFYDWNPQPVINREAYYDVGYVPHMYTNGNVDSINQETAKGGVEKELLEINDLKEKKLISDEEYEKMRKKILGI